jgi:hypothetical protein
VTGPAAGNMGDAISRRHAKFKFKILWQFGVKFLFDLKTKNFESQVSVKSQNSVLNFSEFQ